MKSKFYSDSKSIATTDFGEIVLNLGCKKIMLKNLTIEASEALSADNNYYKFALRKLTQLAIGDPSTPHTILFDPILCEITTSGGVISSGRFEYNLRNREIDLENGNLFVQISNFRAGTTIFRAEIEFEPIEV